jgi:hypothetical protein
VKSPYFDLTNENFEEKILDNEKAALVFFSLTGNITAEYKYFSKVLAEFSGPLVIGVYNINSSAPTAAIKAKYKLSNKFPQLKFFKNTMTG